MNDLRIRIKLDENRRSFQPGETLRGEFSLWQAENSTENGSHRDHRLEHRSPPYLAPADDIKAVEVSVLWHSEGKGDENFDVHEFRRIEADDFNWSRLSRVHRFETILPNSPLTYNGVLLKIRWCVRVRVFCKRGREIVEQLPFVLGNIQAAESIEKNRQGLCSNENPGHGASDPQQL